MWASRRFGFVAFIWLSLVLLSLVGCDLASSPGSTKIVYKVNSHELSSKEFAESLANRLKDYDSVQVKDPEVLRTTKNQILQDFLTSKLVEDWAKQNSMEVSEEELEAEINQIRSQYPNDLSMKQALADSGLKFDEWRSSLKQTLLQKKVFASLKEKVPAPTEEEMKSFFEMNKDQFRRPAAIRVRQVVVATRDEAERLVASTTKSTPLADLARRFSLAPEAKSGGETDWIPKGSVEIFDQVFTWPIGKRSPVLNSPYGYHILEVTAKRPESQLYYSDVVERIRRQMAADREQAAFAAWLEERIKESKIFRNEALINSVSVATKSGP